MSGCLFKRTQPAVKEEKHAGTSILARMTSSGRSVQVLGLTQLEHMGQEANGQSAFAWWGLQHIVRDGQCLLCTVGVSHWEGGREGGRGKGPGRTEDLECYL
jgi:hypothetical protein